MGGALFILILVGVVLLIGFVFNYRTKDEKEQKRKLEESLKDEFIIDPETGAKITLEQAQSGHWVAHDNEFRTTSEEDIQKLYTEAEMETERILNYVRKSTAYRKHKLSRTDIELLESTSIFQKYDSWHYAHCFRIEGRNGVLLFPNPTERGEDHYNEVQILFWLRTAHSYGHYYFREKTGGEKLLDLLRNDDEIKLDGYECFVIRRAESPIRMMDTLSVFKNSKDLEIEFMDEHVFLKNTKNANMSDLYRLELLVKTL